MTNGLRSITIIRVVASVVRYQNAHITYGCHTFRDPTLHPTTYPPTFFPPTREPTLHDCNVYDDATCSSIEDSSKCSSCCENPAAICNDYETAYAQCRNTWGYVGRLDWVIIENQGEDTMRAQTNCIFSSNRNFVFEIYSYPDGEYLNTMIFVDSLTETRINWNCPEFEPLYLTYPTTYVPGLCPCTNPPCYTTMSPAGTPSISPTTIMPTKLGDTNPPTRKPTMAPTSCTDTPCPYSCPEGYIPSKEWTRNDCVVYCMERPEEDQCLPGGSGCESSCVASNSQSSDGGNEMSTTVVVGIGIGGGVIAIFMIFGIFFAIRKLASNIPLKDRENELEKK